MNSLQIAQCRLKDGTRPKKTQDIKALTLARVSSSISNIICCGTSGPAAKGGRARSSIIVLSTSETYAKSVPGSDPAGDQHSEIRMGGKQKKIVQKNSIPPLVELSNKNGVHADDRLFTGLFTCSRSADGTGRNKESVHPIT